MEAKPRTSVLKGERCVMKRQDNLSDIAISANLPSPNLSAYSSLMMPSSYFNH